MTDMAGRGGGGLELCWREFWVVLSSRGLAPVDVDVEAEARIRAGNPHLSGPGLLHLWPPFVSPVARVQAAGYLREDTTPQGNKNKSRNNPYFSSLSCALLITFIIKLLFSYPSIHSLGSFFLSFLSLFNSVLRLFPANHITGTVQCRTLLQGSASVLPKRSWRSEVTQAPRTNPL